MKFNLPPRSKLRISCGRAAALLALGLWGLLTPLRAAEQAADTNKINGASFTLIYPANWTVDTKATGYDKDKYFTLNSPQQSYIQFSIVDNKQDLKKLLDGLMISFDGLAITTLSKSSMDKWGDYSGMGYHLKGKILDSYPGGIKIFVFNYKEHNVMVTEYYFSSELKDVDSDLKLIEDNFKMKTPPDPTPAH